MRRERTVTTVATRKAAPAHVLTLETAGESPRRTEPTPLAEPSAADRIREALLRWLEEDM